MFAPRIPALRCCPAPICAAGLPAASPVCFPSPARPPAPWSVSPLPPGSATLATNFPQTLPRPAPASHPRANFPRLAIPLPVPESNAQIRAIAQSFRTKRGAFEKKGEDPKKARLSSVLAKWGGEGGGEGVGREEPPGTGGHPSHFHPPQQRWELAPAWGAPGCCCCCCRAIEKRSSQPKRQLIKGHRDGSD